MSALARFTSSDPRSGLSRIAGVTPRNPASLPRGIEQGRVGSPTQPRSARFGAARTGVPGRLARGRGLRLMLRGGLMTLAAAGLAAGGLEAATRLVGSHPASADALSTAAPGGRWAEIRHPLPLFDLAATDLSKLPSA